MTLRVRGQGHNLLMQNIFGTVRDAFDAAFAKLLWPLVLKLVL